MSPPADLIKAIRTGLLSEVIAALDAGAPVELDDGKGDPGLPLAMACFTGHAEIVRELERKSIFRTTAFQLRPCRWPFAAKGQKLSKC